MKNPISYNFGLKLLQSALTIGLLNLQSRGLNHSQFSALLLISSIQALVIFFDFGESTKLIQQHLEFDPSGIHRLNESRIILEYIKCRFKLLAWIAILDGLLLQILGLFALHHFKLHIIFQDYLAIFATTFFIFIGWYIGRALIALGEIRLWLSLQAIGSSIQLTVQYFVNKLYPSLHSYLFNTGTSAVFMILATLYILHIRSKNKDDTSLGAMSKNISSYKNVNHVAVQILQLIQVGFLLALPIMLALQMESKTYATFSIQLKIAFTLEAAIGSGLILNWRNTIVINPVESLAESDQVRKSPTGSKIVVGGAFVSIFAFTCINFAWSYLFNSDYKPSWMSWLLWPFVVSTQLMIWNSYFVLLARKKYLALILGSLAQLLSQGMLVLLFKVQSLILAPLILVIPQTICALVYVFSVLVMLPPEG